MYYVIGTSVPSHHRESTDSLMIIYIIYIYTYTCNSVGVYAIYSIIVSLV